jgi:predicted phosphodiesterase
VIKVGVISDIHKEWWTVKYVKKIENQIKETLHGSDIILFCGDIGPEIEGMQLAAKLFPTVPCFYVNGNHEFYGFTVNDVLQKQINIKSHVTFLHQGISTLKIRGTNVRILGSTLWTNFELFGNKPLAMFDAQRNMNDYSEIRIIDNNSQRLITPYDTYQWHLSSRKFFEENLDIPFDGITICMMHHPCAPFGIHPNFLGDSCTPAYASNLTHLFVRPEIKLVAWGHTHYPLDDTIENTRFVSGPMGYFQNGKSQTGCFGKVVEIE